MNLSVATAPRTAIVGAGYAGMATAVALAERGLPCDVFEASQVLGGRARRVELKGITVDNGQHILVGAYRQCLRLMGIVGIDPHRALLHLPLRLELAGSLRVAAPRWPAPLHLAAALLTAHGLTWREKWQATRFMAALALARYRVDTRWTVSALLDAHGQPPRLRQSLWEPLCIATLNTGPEVASAQVFAQVLRDTLGSPRRADSDLLIPQVDLSALFADGAARYVEAHGGTIHRGHRITALRRDEAGWWLDAAPTDTGAAGIGPYASLVLAVAPQHLGALLAPLAATAPELSPCLQALDALAYEPIVTVYLHYPPDTRLAAPMLGSDQGLAQWIFDRGQLGGPAGLIAVVISARGRHQALDNDALAAALQAELRTLCGLTATPLWHRTITEKRATFQCVPGLTRLDTRSPLPGLFFAGDHVACDYPATLEAAMRSGVAAAEAIASDCENRKRQ